MTGVRPQHLQRRAGTYHLRVRVPDDVRVRVGVLEVRRSLRVHTLARARPLALRYAARVMEAFKMVRDQRLSKEDSRALVVACFHDLAAQAEGQALPWLGGDPDSAIEDRKRAGEDYIWDLQRGLGSVKRSADVVSQAQVALAPTGLNLTQLDEVSRADLLDGTPAR